MHKLIQKYRLTLARLETELNSRGYRPASVNVTLAPSHPLSSLARVYSASVVSAYKSNGAAEFMKTCASFLTKTFFR
jgi:hypothetical protein